MGICNNIAKVINNDVNYKIGLKIKSTTIEFLSFAPKQLIILGYPPIYVSLIFIFETFFKNQTKLYDELKKIISNQTPTEPLFVNSRTKGGFS